MHPGSAALEFRRALFGEGSGAFLRVGALEDLDAEGGVDLECLFLVHAFGVADGLQDRLDGEGAVGGDEVGEFEGLVEGLTVGDDVPMRPISLASGALM